jgi:hypothetical protein
MIEAIDFRIRGSFETHDMVFMRTCRKRRVSRAISQA